MQIFFVKEMSIESEIITIIFLVITLLSTMY